jgi:hypothetical protein
LGRRRRGGDGDGDGEGFDDGDGDGDGVKVALGDIAIASIDAMSCVLVESLLGRMLIRAVPIDTAAAIAASHRAMFDIFDVESGCRLKPHFKQYSAFSDTSVPHFWQNTAKPF